jgi:hypothetical protein
MAQSTEINPRLTENTCDEPDVSLMPLEDYQHFDLVSLETATETIKTLFHNLPRDIWIAKNASKKPADTLTSDESAAIHLYSMELKDQPLYLLLNKLLRHRDRRKLKPLSSNYHHALQKLFGVELRQIFIRNIILVNNIHGGHFHLVLYHLKCLNSQCIWEQLEKELSSPSNVSMVKISNHIRTTTQKMKFYSYLASILKW